MFRYNPDDRYRQALRAAAMGDIGAKAIVLSEQLRTGKINPDQIWLAMLMGDEASYSLIADRGGAVPAQTVIEMTDRYISFEIDRYISFEMPDRHISFPEDSYNLYMQSLRIIASELSVHFNQLRRGLWEATRLESGHVIQGWNDTIHTLGTLANTFAFESSQEYINRARFVDQVTNAWPWVGTSVSSVYQNQEQARMYQLIKDKVISHILRTV